jgi:predicted HicB family RNase H-like nuclease
VGRAESSPRRGLLALLLLVAFAGAAGAESRVPYGGPFREEIDATFFDLAADDLGRVSPVKLRAYRDYIARKLRVLEAHVYNHETIDRGRSDSAARERIRKLDTTIALEHILDLLGRMEREDDPAASYGHAAEILMVDYATRSFTEPIASVKIPVHLKNVIFEWRLENATRPSGAPLEASNLVNPETGGFYTAGELEAMIRAGFDISTLNPPDETPFWRAKQDIASVDVVGNYLSGADPMHAGVPLRFPDLDGAEFEFDEVHMTQSKPKLDVFYLDEECREKRRAERKKCRKKLKLKFGMETHADPVANALLAALGFNADVSMHLKNVRVKLGARSHEEVERDWIGYFDRQRMHTYIPIESVLHEGEAGRGRDAQGDYYVFKETAAELKPAEIDRIGFFSFSRGMAAEAREARALFLFNAWVGNADMKDEENNKLVLRKGADGERRMYLVQQDIGHSLGWVLPERPEAFPWELVETHAMARAFGWANRSIELDYIDLQDTGLERSTTFADAKWMARLIAQLTRQQIEDAVGLGRWPGGIPQLYVEKLVNRRNQLVQVFGLEGEFELMPVDRHLTTADGSVVDGHLAQNRWETSPVNFDRHLEDLMDPVFKFVADRAIQGLQSAISAVDVIDPGDITITGKLAVFPRILLNLSRQVLLNPEPEGAFDQYIVVDSVTVGFRIGIGFIGSVEGTLLKKYSLAYPVATRHEGIRAGIGVVDFLLPLDVRKGKLPEKYVLYREAAFKSGFGISSDDSQFISPVGVAGNQNRVLAHRSVIDRRNANPIVWVDAPKSLERDVYLFLELAVLQVPFLGAHTSNGTVAGEVWSIDGGKLGVVGDDGVPIFDRMVQKADFREVEKIALDASRKASSDFNSREVWWNLLFANWRSRASEEKITLTDAAGRPLREERRVERRRRFSWSFLDNGETQEFRVTGFLGGPNAGGRAGEKPVVVTNYRVDDLDTHSDELDSYYDLLVGIGAGQSDLAPEFEAADWEVSGEPAGRWTRMLTEGEIRLYPESLRRLTQIDTEGFWRLLARNLGVSEAEFAHQRALVRPSVSKDHRAARRSPIGRLERSIIARSIGVLKTLARARAADSDEERLRLFVQAIYRSCFETGDTFNPVILATLIEQSGVAELIERDAIAIEARIRKAFEDQHNLPERRDVAGRLGAEQEAEPVRYRFFPFGGIEIYNMLNWVSETE